MELFKASKQWATRPVDERFWDLASMRQECERYKGMAVEADVDPRHLRAEADDGEVYLLGKTESRARLTHYAFGQLAQRVGAPAAYLRDLPATLAVQNLNHGLKARGEEMQKQSGDLALMFHRNGDLLLRCVTGTGYARIWNADIVARLEHVAAEGGWRVPPARPAVEEPPARPATAADLLMHGGSGGLAIREGDMIAPAGLYASDRDMFAFLVREDYALRNPLDPATPLNRGFMVWNSEVGDTSFGVLAFLYDAVCGNHIVWGAREVKELRVRHVGTANDRAWSGLAVELREYAESSASDDEARIARAQQYVIAPGGTQRDVVEAVMQWARARRVADLTEKVVADAYDVADATPRYGSPHSPWALAQGVTVLSQKSAHASRRVALDRAAGRIPEIAF